MKNVFCINPIFFFLQYAVVLHLHPLHIHEIHTQTVRTSLTHPIRSCSGNEKFISINIYDRPVNPFSWISPWSWEPVGRSSFYLECTYLRCRWIVGTFMWHLSLFSLILYNHPNQSLIFIDFFKINFTSFLVPKK